MGNECKVGAGFATEREALQCVTRLENNSRLPHFIEQYYHPGSIGAGSTYFVGLFENNQCQDGSQFTEDGLPIYKNEIPAKDCAEALNRLTGLDYVAQIIKKAGWFGADHYQVVKK